MHRYRKAGASLGHSAGSGKDGGGAIGTLSSKDRHRRRSWRDDRHGATRWRGQGNRGMLHARLEQTTRNSADGGVRQKAQSSAILTSGEHGAARTQARQATVWSTPTTQGGPQSS